MAQIKKLQQGSTITKEPEKKKLLYNNVELTNDDINNIVSTLGDWGAKNSKYSEDIKSWSDLGNAVKSELQKGNIPEFDTTGTGMKLGDINIGAGDTHKNIFSNWTDKHMGSQYSSLLKNALDQTIAQKTKPATQTPTTKTYFSPVKLIAKSDYNDNMDLFESGFSKLSKDERKNKIRLALKDSINKYSQEYGSFELSNRLSELDNPKIDDKTLSEIGYKMGEDINELLSNTKSQGDNQQQSQIIDETSDLGQFAKSKGLKLIKDDKGIQHLLNPDNSEFSGGGIETIFGKYYGYGLFKDPTTNNWIFGKKDSFNGTGVYQTAQQAYQNLYNKNQTELSTNDIDFSHETSNVFGTDTYKPFKDKNKFSFYDISNSFSGLNNKDGKVHRLIIPKLGSKSDDLGALDLVNNKAFMTIDNKSTPVTLELNSNSDSYAITPTGERINLGAFGYRMGSQGEWNGYKSSTELGFVPQKMELNDMINAQKSVKGFENVKVLNNSNIKHFISNVLNNNFNTNLNLNEQKRLAQYVTNLYNWHLKGKNILNSQELTLLRNKIKELNNSQVNLKTNQKEIPQNNQGIKLYTTGMKKGGAIIKAQMGTTLIKGSSTPKIQDVAITKQTPTSGEARLKDKWSTSDTLDMTATGLDAVSLAGGVVGVGAGIASTLVQAVSDYKRSGVSKDMLENLGINLGFTALAFIPGASAAKIGKIAKEVKNVEKAAEFIKDTEKAVKVLGKVEGLSEESKLALKAVDKAKKMVQASKNPAKFTSFMNKAVQNPFIKASATGARVGFAGLGVTNGIQSAANIVNDTSNEDLSATKISDWRGLVGGVAGVRAGLGMVNNKLIRIGTEPIKSTQKQVTELGDDANLLAKGKAKFGDLSENTKQGLKSGWKKYVTDDWANRQLSTEENPNWLKRQGIKAAKKAGFDNSTTDYLNNINTLNNARFNKSVFDYMSSRPKKYLALPEHFENNKISGKYPVAEESYDPVKTFQSLVNKTLNPKVINVTPKKSIRPKNKTGINGNTINSLKRKGLINNEGQISIDFHKQGGKLINKFYTGGQYIPYGKFNSPTDWRRSNNKYSPEYLNLVNDENFYNTNKNDIQTAVSRVSKYRIKDYNDFKRLATDLKPGPVHDLIYKKSLPPQVKGFNTEINKINLPDLQTKVQSGITNQPTKINLPNYQTKKLDIDTTAISKLPKLLSNLSTNRKNIQLLSSVFPALVQAPNEIYKPVMTNLANENFVKNQTTDYLHQADRTSQGTSDYNKSAAIKLEAFNKTIPMNAQARAENTDLYNRSLEASRESAEKYAGIRNEVANQNLQRITASQEANARYAAGENVANNASWNNYFDKVNQSLYQNKQYKNALNNAEQMSGYQREFESKLKPFKESYENLAKDYKQSNTYKEFANLLNKKPQTDWNSIGNNGKTLAQSYNEELENSKNAYSKESERLQPYYESLRNQLIYKNPNSFTWSYKSGGSLDTKIEVQNLKNKLKQRELDDKNANKSIDRKQQEVKSILNGLSKETFFLLKTVLGK